MRGEERRQQDRTIFRSFLHIIKGATAGGILAPLHYSTLNLAKLKREQEVQLSLWVTNFNKRHFPSDELPIPSPPL